MVRILSLSEQGCLFSVILLKWVQPDNWPTCNRLLLGLASVYTKDLTEFWRNAFVYFIELTAKSDWYTPRFCQDTYNPLLALSQRHDEKSQVICQVEKKKKTLLPQQSLLLMWHQMANSVPTGVLYPPLPGTEAHVLIASALRTLLAHLQRLCWNVASAPSVCCWGGGCCNSPFPSDSLFQWLPHTAKALSHCLSVFPLHNLRGGLSRAWRWALSCTSLGFPWSTSGRYPSTALSLRLLRPTASFCSFWVLLASCGIRFVSSS